MEVGAAGVRTNASWLRRLSVPLGLGLASLAAFQAHAYYSSGGALPGPAPARDERDFVQLNAQCEGCHQDVAAEWRLSRHSKAFDNAAFARSYAGEPTAFCRDCHAPESATRQSEAADRMGVACVTCHLAGDAVMAAPSDSFRLAPHRLERSQAFGESGGCAGCHEFTFGDDERREAPLLMQRTVSEHAQSGVQESCADCHMPRGSHAFGSTRDPNAHRAALAISAERDGPSRLRVKLEPRGLGHAYPTGDLFRRVKVSAEILGDDFQSRGEASVYLGRRFEDGRDIHAQRIRNEVTDERVFSGPEASAKEVVLELGPAAIGSRIRYQVSLERVLFQRDGESAEAQAVVDESIELSSGIVQ